MRARHQLREQGFRTIHFPPSAGGGGGGQRRGPVEDRPRAIPSGELGGLVSPLSCAVSVVAIPGTLACLHGAPCQDAMANQVAPSLARSCFLQPNPGMVSQNERVCGEMQHTGRNRGAARRECNFILQLLNCSQWRREKIGGDSYEFQRRPGGSESGWRREECNITMCLPPMLDRWTSRLWWKRGKGV